MLNEFLQSCIRALSCGPVREERVHDAGVASVTKTASAASGSAARWLISAVLLVAIATAFFDRINVAVLFTNPQFHADIGVSDPARMGMLMTAFVLPYGVSAVSYTHLTLPTNREV